MERRTDPWADFLRRILLSASLAGAATVATKAGTDTPPPEMADAEPGTTASAAAPATTAA
jgi:hypothetical protein